MEPTFNATANANSNPNQNQNSNSNNRNTNQRESGRPELEAQDMPPDCTIACEKGHITAHKLILCDHSKYLQDILMKYPTAEHPIIILTELNIVDIRILVNYMYTGELVITNDSSPTSLLRAAQILKIDSLTAHDDDEEEEDEEDEDVAEDRDGRQLGLNGIGREDGDEEEDIITDLQHDDADIAADERDDSYNNRDDDDDVDDVDDDFDAFDAQDADGEDNDDIMMDHEDEERHVAHAANRRHHHHYNNNNNNNNHRRNDNDDHDEDEDEDDEDEENDDHIRLQNIATNHSIRNNNSSNQNSRLINSIKNICSLNHLIEAVSPPPPLPLQTQQTLFSGSSVPGSSNTTTSSIGSNGGGTAGGGTSGSGSTGGQQQQFLNLEFALDPKLSKSLIGSSNNDTPYSLSQHLQQQLSSALDLQDLQDSKHFDNKNNKIRCHLCNIGLSDVKCLYRHVLTRHLPEKWGYKCEFCDREFSRDDHLMRHYTTKHKNMEFNREKIRETRRLNREMAKNFHDQISTV